MESVSNAPQIAIDAIHLISLNAHHARKTCSITMESASQSAQRDSQMKEKSAKNANQSVQSVLNQQLIVQHAIMVSS